MCAPRIQQFATLQLYHDSIFQCGYFGETAKINKPLPIHHWPSIDQDDLYVHSSLSPTSADETLQIQRK